MQFCYCFKKNPCVALSIEQFPAPCCASYRLLTPRTRLYFLMNKDIQMFITMKDFLSKKCSYKQCYVMLYFENLQLVIFTRDISMQCARFLLTANLWFPAKTAISYAIQCRELFSRQQTCDFFIIRVIKCDLFLKYVQYSKTMCLFKKMILIFTC